MAEPPLPVGYATQTRSNLSVTRFFGLGLTPGKLRGLQRISNANGTLTMVATDQNSAMIGLIQEARGDKSYTPTYDEMVDAKCELAACMSAYASGVLIDAYFGALSAVASWSLPPRCGMLVRIEKSGAKFTMGPAKDLPMADYEEGLNVGKIKRMGADAVKLLAPFEPTQHDSAEHQMAFVQEVYEECRRHDILMVLEPVAMEFVKSRDASGKAIKESKKAKDGDHYVVRKPHTVIETAKYLSPFCDIYKAEFPGTMGYDDARHAEYLKALNEACARPWVLLSAGVDYEQFRKQVEMAVAAGASGILGGRAFWKEYFVEKKKGPEAGAKYLREVCAERVREINAIVQERATPWFRRYGLTWEQIKTTRTAEGWHKRYGEVIGRGSASVLRGDETY
jgi:tagatose 1,6-diphosphate aldolase